MAVKTFSLKRDGETKLSEHFKVKEFRCKDGSDEIKIEMNMIPILEKIHAHFGASAVNIVSGYRTPKHDKAVGGKGSGNHCEGKAVDFVVKQNGKAVQSAKVALYLEDIGMTGIGYKCGGSATSTHMDVNYRTFERRWYGDESVSMSKSIHNIKAGCNSYYDYIYGKGKWELPVKVTAKSGLWSRKGAGTSYAKVRINPYGTKLTIVQKSNDLKWGKTTDGTWVCLDYTEVIY